MCKPSAENVNEVDSAIFFPAHLSCHSIFACSLSRSQDVQVRVSREDIAARRSVMIKFCQH